MAMRPCAGLILLSSVIAPYAVYAQQAEDDPVYEQVARRLRRHHDREALQMMRERFEATHELRAEATMGLVERNLEEYRSCATHIAAALNQPPTPWITTNRGTLESVLQVCRRQLLVGALVVRCAAEDAAVFMNGSRVGDVGHAIELPQGRSVVEVRAPGFATRTRTVEISLGETRTETIDLEREAPPAPTPVAAPTPATPPIASAAPQPEASPTTPSSPTAAATLPSPSGLPRTLAWASGAGALVFAGVGIAAHVVGSDAADQWNGSTCVPPNGLTRDQNCHDSYATAQTMDALRWVGFVGAGALAVTSAVLFVTSAPRTTSRTSMVSCTPTLGAPGILCGGRF